MTELELIQRAKIYMDKLANGINPLDDTVIPDEDVVNQVKLSRCFFFVSDVLRRVVENGGPEKPQKKKKGLPFCLPYEARTAFEYSENPIPVSEIAKRINALKPDAEMKNFSYKCIVQYMLNLGLLELQILPDGKTAKSPTQAGREMGILTEERVGADRTYQVILYDKAAQAFIVENLDAILAEERTCN